MQGPNVGASLHRLIWLLRANDVEVKLRKLARSVEAKFNPNQPRVPAGNPDGGQWIDAGGAPIASGEPMDFSSMRRISIDLEEECWAQHGRDIFHCRMVGVPACYEQAKLRYANCLVGLPIPPLNY